MKKISLKYLAALTFSFGCTLANATWHTNEEGESFADFDSDSTIFSLYPAGIYEGADYFSGTIGTPADSSDEIKFTVGSNLYRDNYRLTAIRLTFGGNASASNSIALNQGSKLSLDLASSAGTSPLLLLDLSTSKIDGESSFVANNLSYGRHQIYLLKVKSDALALSDGSPVRYNISFTVSEVAAIPEPEQWVLVLAGSLVLCRRANYLKSIS